MRHGHELGRFGVRGGSTVGTMTDGTMHLLDPAPFGRILPAMVTPMKADGAVDFEAAQTAGEAAGCRMVPTVIVVNGTTGESPTTHMEEKVELVQAVKEVVDVPVISGAGSNDTAHTVRMVEQTQEAGADAVLVVAPYYSRPSQEGVFRHYKAVNDSADKPIIVYDVPGPYRTAHPAGNLPPFGRTRPRQGRQGRHRRHRGRRAQAYGNRSDLVFGR